MEGINFNCTQDAVGNVSLYNKEDCNVYLQGDDATAFNAQWNEILAIWTRKFGKGYRKHFGPFGSYGEHMDYLISQYFMEDSHE